jgi:predicted  nucleic acid-binding Zn-ribbon protein
MSQFKHSIYLKLMMTLLIVFSLASKSFAEVEYSNGYIQASIVCGKSQNGENGWNATLDGYVNPAGFILYRNWIGREGEIGYHFFEAKKSKAFNSKSGFLITGTGVMESGKPWDFRFSVPPESSLIDALKAGITGFENPSSTKWKRKCTLTSRRIYRPVHPEAIERLQNEIDALNAASESGRNQLRTSKIDNQTLKKELSESESRIEELSNSLRSLKSELSTQKKANADLSAQLNQTKQNVSQLQTDTKKTNELETKLSKLVAERKKMAAKLANLEQINKSISSSLEDIKGSQTQKAAEYETLTKKNAQLVQALADLEMAHKQEIAELKKLVPEATLQNEKLTKIASDASSQNQNPISNATNSASKIKIKISFRAEILAKAKEFGDGFTNYEAPLNKVLIAVEIRDLKFDSSSEKNTNQLEYVLFDEGKPAIPESKEAREAILAQGVQGSRTNLVKAFEIPMNIDTGTLKVVALNGSTIVGETKLKPE